MPEPALAWWQLHHGPLSAEDVHALLVRLAAQPRRQPVVFEARAARGEIVYLVGTRPESADSIQLVMQSLLPDSVTTPLGIERVDAARAARLVMKRQALALSTETPIGPLKALLSAAAEARVEDEHLIVQLVLGPGIAPHLVTQNVEDPLRSIPALVLHGRQAPSAEVLRSMRSKQNQYGFRGVLRVAAIAGTEFRRRHLMVGMLSALRTLQAPGTTIGFTAESGRAITDAKAPLRWPLRISSSEAAQFLLWPVGDDDLPGRAPVHPRLLPPPRTYRPSDRTFAAASAPGQNMKLGIDHHDARFHTLAIGPTGSGKSTVLLRLIAADMEAGRGIVVLDPKSDLANAVLARVPEHRKDDVVVMDPTSPLPVGMNVVAQSKNPELTADGILATFMGLFPDAFGPRTTDIVHAAILTIARNRGTTIVDLPRLLSDAAFRSRLIGSLNDPVGLGPFWTQYNALSPQQQAQVIAPALSRFRQFLLRPSLTRILGQAEPRFDMADIFTKRRIVILPLNKGLVGPEASRLLGSLFVAQFWQLALARTEIPEARRHTVSIYIDEVQNYLHLADLDEALSMSRSLGVAWHLAHQYRSQVPNEILAGIDANTRNKIIFALDAEDAGAIARRAPQLSSDDFQALGKYEIYANLMNHGQSTGWISGRTLPEPPEISDPIELRALSQDRYGAAPVAADSEMKGAPSTESSSDGPVGRRPRRSA